MPVKKTCFLLFLVFGVVGIKAQNNADAILGKWITIQNNLKVEIYKQNNIYKAKILWFKDTDDKSQPMELRVDNKNPDKSLRSRKWIGMEVLRGLKYNTEDKEWEDGKIYVAKNGKEWDSVAWITKDNCLKVKGYWLFKFLSQTLAFKRV
ncbi:MAG: DUF2147 domain-containing protein [Ginsengibacter sp.]